MLALYRCGRQAEALDAYRERDARSSTSRRRARPGAAAPARGDPAPGPRARRRGRPPRSCRASSTPPARRRSSGATASCAAARTLAARARRRGALVALVGAARDGQDAAGGRARRRRAPRRGDRAVRGRRGSARGGARRDRAARAAPAADVLVARRRRPRRRRRARRAARARVELDRDAGARARDRRRRPRTSRPSATARARRRSTPTPSRRSPCSTRRRRRGARRRAARRERGRPAACARARRRVGAARGGAARRRRRRPRRGRPRAGAGARGRARRERRRAPVHARARRTCSRRPTTASPWSARSRASRPSTSTTPTTSSGASGSSRELVARLVGSPLLGDRRAVGQRQVLGRCAPGCCPRSPAGCSRAASGWARALIRPGEHPLRELRRATDGLPAIAAPCWRSTSSRSCFTACRDAQERERVRRRARARGARSATSHRRRAGAARRLLRPLRRATPSSRACVGANHVLVGPMAPRRAAARDRAARRSASGCASSPSSWTRSSRTSRASPARCRCCRRRCSSSGSSATAAPAARRLRAQRRRRGRGRAAGRGRVRRASTAGSRRVARALLLRLAGEETSGASCAAASRSPSSSRSAASTRAVLDVLAERRLLTVGEGTVEVAHEALLREWPRLRGWLEEDAEGRRLHRQLADAARDWDAGGRDPGELYRGARLAVGARLARRARARAQRRRARVPRRRPQPRASAPGAACGSCSPASSRSLVLAVIAGAVALDQRGRAREQARAAEAQRLGAQALVERRLDRCAAARPPGRRPRRHAARRADNLLAALLPQPGRVGVMRGDGDALSDHRRSSRTVGPSRSATPTARSFPRRPHPARGWPRRTRAEASPGSSRSRSAPTARRLATTGWDRAAASLTSSTRARTSAHRPPRPRIRSGASARTCTSRPDSRVLALQTLSRARAQSSRCAGTPYGPSAQSHVQPTSPAGRLSCSGSSVHGRSRRARRTLDGHPRRRPACALRRYPVADSARSLPAAG